MITFFKTIINKVILERVFNIHTPKGITQLIVAIVLNYVGFSEDFIKYVMSWEWTFVDDFILKYKIHIQVIGIILLLFGFFNVFRKAKAKMHVEDLKNKLEEKQIELQIKKTEKELTSYKNFELD